MSVLEDIRDGVKHLICKHKKELCDTCCMDFTMVNAFERKRYATEEGKKEKKAIKEDARTAGCANPGCMLAGQKGGDSGAIKFLYCNGCRKVCYCSRDCQRLHWPSHKGPCKSNRVQIKLKGGSTVAVHPLGSKLELIARETPTGVICQVVQFQSAEKKYIIQDLEEAETIEVPADSVGPTDYLNREGELVRSKPDQPWKILQGTELLQNGFIVSGGRAYPFPLGGSVCFFPYGQGPFIRGEVVQKYDDNKPTGEFCRIAEVVFPDGKKKKKKKPSAGDEDDDDDGDFGKDISLEELKDYSYVLQPCPRGRLLDNTFTIDVADAHDETKWKVLK